MPEERDSLLVTPQIFADLPLEAEDEARFQFEAYADTFARIIANPATETPLTICISGEWGTGKTTLMKAIRSRLDQTRETEERVPDFVNSQEEAKGLRVCKTVWFNAWKYAGQQEAMFVALIEEILREMRRDGFINRLYANLSDPKQPGVRLPEAVLSTLTRVLTAGQIDIDMTSFYTESRFKTNLAFLDEFQIFFDRLLNWYVGREGGEDEKGVLVVFIDDLDRCLPDKTVQMLETIKLFLDKPACVFILGADTDVIQSAIEAHYETEKIEEVKAKDYLDKIIQLQFELPPIRQADMEVFVQELKLRDEALLSSLEIIAGGVRTNPRRVKTFINYLEFQWALLVNSGQAKGVRRQDFTQWLVLTEAGPDFCATIRNLPRAERVEYILDAAALAQGKEDEVLRERHGQWLERYPRLRRVLAQKGFTFEVDPDTLDRFIFLSAPPVEVVEEAPVPPGRKPRAAAPHERAVSELAEVPETVLVPAGPFLMGSTEDNELATDREHPQHQVKLDAFLIGRYPVTNAQYARFIEGGGYENQAYWTEAGWAWREEEGSTQPRYWGDPKWNQPNYPVVGVSWYEVLAYCRWLSEVTGQEFRLPTEAEWEKAARGEHGREWPWGNEFDPQKANTSEGGHGRTTPVGQYSPGGDSPYGASDMAGNVFEWCSTLKRDYPYQPDDGREDPESEGSRVLRGGSWFSSQGYARCADRHRYYPDPRGYGLGFRVAAPPSSP
jgi:formylglycine-generating enzyme required for sulfatase activity